MHEFAGFNHAVKLVSEIYLPAVSSAAFYGRSIFTTVAVYNKKPFQWEKHWRRLNENAACLDVDLSNFSREKVETSVFAVIAENNLRNGRIRLTFFDESANGIWSLQTNDKTSLLITTADFRAASDNFRLTVSPFSINSKSPLVNLKSGNYLENILALEEARRRGFDESVRLNEKGEIVSAAMANIFWINQDMIYTPPLETGALRGTTREFIIENFQVVEKKINLAELKSADEIFLTSAGIGVAEVAGFEKKIFSNFTIFNNIRNFFKIKSFD